MALKCDRWYGAAGTALLRSYMAGIALLRRSLDACGRGSRDGSVMVCTGKMQQEWHGQKVGVQTPWTHKPLELLASAYRNPALQLAWSRLWHCFLHGLGEQRWHAHAGG